MQTENNTQKKTGSKISITKVILWMLFFLLLFFLIPFFAIPAYLSSDSGKNLILTKVSGSIGGKIKIDSLSMGWFSGVKAQQLDYTDKTGCTNITANQVAARPRYLDLLAGKLSIDQAVIDQPKVSVDMTGPCAPQKTQQQQQAPETEPQTPSSPPAALLAVSNINLTVNQGSVKIVTPDINNTIKILELRDINSKLALRPLGSKSTFDVSMAVAGANEVSNIAVSGQVKTPKKEWSLAETSGQISIDVNDLELSTLSSLFAVMDVNVTASGRVKANMEAQIQKGLFENLQGTINASNLDISGSAIKGDRIQTSKLQTDVKLNTTEKAINIDRLKIETDGLTADVKGTIPKTLRSFEDFLKADSSDTLQAQFDCDVAKTFTQVKTIAGFKEDFDINYGRLSGSINTDAQNGKRTLSGKVKLWALEGKFPVKRIILSKPVELDAKITSQQDKIIVEKFILDSAFAKANLTGTTENMTYQAALDLAQMQSDVGQFFEIKPALTGDVNLIGKAALAKGVLSSTGTGSFSNILVKMPDGSVISEPAANVKYDFTSDFENKKLTVRTAQIAASAGKINLKNSTLPLDSASPAPLQLTADMNIDLEKTMPYLRTFGKIDPNIQLAGSASGDIALGIKDNIIDVITRQIKVAKFKLTYPGRQTFSQEYMDLAFSGRFDNTNKIYTIEKLSLTSPQIKIAGKLTNAQTGQNIKTEGTFNADYDLAAAGSLVSPFLPSGFSATGKRNDSIWFSTVYPKQNTSLFMNNLSAKTSFGFDSAEYMGLSLGKSEFNVKIDNGLMTIAPFTSTVNGGKLNFAASANFKDKPSLLKTPGQMKIFDGIQITQQTSDILLGYINPIFAGATNVSGTLNFDCEKLIFPLEKGYDKSIAVIGTLSISNMHLGSPLLNTILPLIGGPSDPLITVQPTKFTVANGIISYDNMQMDIDKYPVNFAGKIGLDKTMQMTITLPWSRNGQRVKLPLKGSVDKPQIDMGQLLQEQVQQELENQIKEGLEKIFK